MTPHGRLRFAMRWGYYFGGVALAITCSVFLLLVRAGMQSYGSGHSTYTNLAQQASPDGSKVALVFREETAGEKWQHVRILNRAESFVPPEAVSRFDRSDVAYPFEFSIERTKEVRVMWKDENDVVIHYWLDGKLSRVYQRRSGIGTSVNINYVAELSADK